MRTLAAHKNTIAAIIAGVLLLALAPFFILQGMNAYEDFVLAHYPTAQRAYDYGELHFDAKTSFYDIDRAERYFKIAARLDPTLLYVNHELARISFLRGKFDLALSQINFQISMHGDETINSYYIRGLIEGYMGQYDAAGRDFKHFIDVGPRSWAEYNDYAWVLLKAERFSDAVDVTAQGLVKFPDNPWLLNNRAIALYELHRYADALIEVRRAVPAVEKLTSIDWLYAYPGNDPALAAQGLAVFKESVHANMHRIEGAIASSTVQ